MEEEWTEGETTTRVKGERSSVVEACSPLVERGVGGWVSRPHLAGRKHPSGRV